MTLEGSSSKLCVPASYPSPLLDSRHHEDKVQRPCGPREPDRVLNAGQEAELLLNGILEDEAEARRSRQFLPVSGVGRRMVYGRITDPGHVLHHSICQLCVQETR